MLEGNKTYTLCTGKYFGDVGAGLAFGLIVFGIIFFPFGLMAIPAGLYFLLTSYGVKIDLDNKRLMHYVNHFGFLTAGKWQENNLYKEIAIIGVTKRQYGNIHGAQVGGQSWRQIQIVLLDQHHIKRIELMEADTLEEAEQKAREITLHTGYPLVKFDPVQIIKKRRR